MIAAIAVACSLLLKISLVSVSGSSVYSQQDVINACTIKQGDNLVTADAKKAEKEIEKNLPYVEKATVTKKFPSKVDVNVSPASVQYAFSQGGVYVLVSKDYKVLEIKNTCPENTCVVEGAVLLSPTPGEKCSYLNIESAVTVEEVLTQMQNCGYDFSKITSISFVDEGDISYVYENRVKVKLGLPTDLEYKLTFSRSILLNEDGKGLTESDIGIFDISLASDTNRGIFQKLDSLEDEGKEDTPQDDTASENSEDENSENGDENTEENSENSDGNSEETSESSEESTDTQE